MSIGDSSNNDGRVFGTWDFKWPQGTIIKISFQEWPGNVALEFGAIHFDPEESERALLVDGKTGKIATGYGYLTRVVECLARRWLVQRPNIAFEFDHDQLVPLAAGGGQAANNEYDVLVSLTPLPQFQQREVLEDDAQEGPIQKKYFLPGSELGRYAQRVDYGTPTTYLGKREHLAGSLESYFSSDEFRHWVLHEFGHVLGLVHEQQNPNINGRLNLKPTGDVVAILSRSLGYTTPTDITVAEVDEEIVNVWPSLPNGLFCDFRKYRRDDPADDTMSVMFHIYWQRIVEGGSETADALFYSHPHPRDLAALGNMYPALADEAARGAPPRQASAPRAKARAIAPA